MCFTTSTANAFAAPAPEDMYECLNHSHVWDKRQCPEFKSTGPAGFPGSGGPSGPGGLLGVIGKVLGGIGGLL